MSDSSTFDPYSEWLDIPPDRRPPTHYDLLGVAEFEEDSNAIHLAALRQVAKLRKHQAGARSEWSQRLMNEVSQARVVLLDAAQRAEYDEKLRASRGSSRRIIPSALRLPLAVSAATLLLIVLAVGALFVARKSSTTTAKLDVDPVAASRDLDGPATPREETASPKPSGKSSTLDRPPGLAGLKVLWESSFRPNEPTLAFCRYLFPTDPMASLTDARRLEIAAPPDQERALFWPVPKGDTRFLVHFVAAETRDVGHRLRFGAFHSPDRFAGVDLRPGSNGWKLESASPDSEGVISGNEYWLDARRHGSRWLIQCRSGAGDFVPLGEFDDPAPVVLGIQFRNAGAGSMRTSIEHVRIEGTDPDYVTRLADWPAVVPTPRGDRLKELFTGEFALETDHSASLRYSFLSDRELTAWGARRADRGATVPSGARVEFGPIDQIRTIRLPVAFSSEHPTLVLSFTDGGSVRFDSKQNTIALTAEASGPFPFEPGKDYRCAIAVSASGKVRVSVDDKEVVTAEEKRSTGRLVVSVEGEGSVDVREFALHGRFDALAIWMDRLRGVDNALSPDNRPSRLTVIRERILPPAPYIEVSKPSSIAVPLEWKKGVPIHLESVNAPADESFPVATADGLELHFSRRSKDGHDLFFATRTSTDEHFSGLRQLNGLPNQNDQHALALEQDRRTAFFVSNHDDAKQLDIFVASRTDTERAFGAVEAVHAVRSSEPELDCFLTSDGLELYFTRLLADGPAIFRAARSKASDRFADPVRVDLGKRELRRPTLTSDNLVMFVEGHPTAGAAQILRTTRKAASDPWGKPQPIAELETDSPGRVGDVAPFVTGEGSFLYFSSDRAGGAGGLDLWALPLTDPPAEQPSTPAGPPPGTITEWLVLGPIAREEGETTDALRKLANPRIRRSARIDVLGYKQLKWQRSATLPAEPGIYFIAFSFGLKKNAEVKIMVDRAPGGVLLWLNDDPIEIEGANADPWASIDSDEPVSTGKITLARTRAVRLFGVVCSTDPDTPLVIRFADPKTNQPFTDFVPNL